MYIYLEINNQPFIQFFSGWKWKAVRCQRSMLSDQPKEGLEKRRDAVDFSETPWAGPRERGRMRACPGLAPWLAVGPDDRAGLPPSNARERRQRISTAAAATQSRRNCVLLVGDGGARSGWRKGR